MAPGIRRTADGIELTARTVRALTVLCTALLFLAALGAKALATSQKIDGAVQRKEFEDTTRALRADLRTTIQRVDTTSRNLLAMSCQQNGYPLPWCSDIPRTTQAGQPRSAP